MKILELLTALLPICFLVLALGVLKMQGYKACLISLGLAAVLAGIFWNFPLPNILTAAAEGILSALWPVCIAIIAALFTYHLTEKTGAMEKIRRLLCGVSADKRVIALLIGWGFGNFMEGVAGFGTAVAIPAAIMVGVGLDPLSSVVACLVVNSTPTVFGSVGVPAITLASVTNLLPIFVSDAAVTLQLVLTILSPFFFVAICGKSIKALRGIFPLVLLSSVSFALPWFLAGKFLGPELPNILGSVCSMGSMVFASRFVKDLAGKYQMAESDISGEKLSKKEILLAALPYLLVFAFLVLCSNLFPPIHNIVASVKSSVSVYCGEDPAVITFSWLNTAGVMILLAGIIGGVFQKASPKTMVLVMKDTLVRYGKTVLTICAVMAMAKIMSYSGMIALLAKTLVAVSGEAYPLLAPVIGALGGFITGSGTSSNVLFGPLQTEAAAVLGLAPRFMAAANVMGAGIGKMICPQGIAIGVSASGGKISESMILKAVFGYFLFYLLAASISAFLAVLF